MCCSEEKWIKCVLMTFSVLAMISCILRTYVLYEYMCHVALEVFGLIFMLLSAILGIVLYCKETIPLALVYSGTTALLAIFDCIQIFLKHVISGEHMVKISWEHEMETPGAMDIYQKTYHCCGKNSLDDYQNLLHRPIPASCNSSSDGSPYEKGCITEVPDKDISRYFRYHTFDLFWFCFACLIIYWLNRKNRQIDNGQNSIGLGQPVHFRRRSGG